MSLEAITWAYKTQVRSATCKAVLLVLANYADEEDSSYPSANRISSMTQLANSTVRKALDELEEDGVITREARTRGKDGGQTSNRYVIDLTWTPPADSRQGGCSEEAGGVPTVGTRDTKRNREKETKPPVAPRATVERTPRLARSKRAVADTDDGQERTGSLPDDGPSAPTDLAQFRSKRKPSTVSVVEEFAERALATTTVPAAQRDTVKGALGRWVKKQVEQGVTHAQLLAAMDKFFPNAKSFAGTKPLWKAFETHFVELHHRATAPDITNPDHYTDQKKTPKENVAWTQETWIAEQARLRLLRRAQS